MPFDIKSENFAPLVQMVQDHAAARPDDVAMRQKEFGIWNEITWKGLQEIMQACAAGLMEVGVERFTATTKTKLECADLIK